MELKRELNNSKVYGSINDEQSDEQEPERITISLEAAIESVGFGKYQIKFLFLLALAQVAESMELMLLSLLSPALECEWDISDVQQALLTTFVFLGMLSTSSLWGKFSDKVGRKPGLLVATGCTFIFGLLSALSPSYIWLLVLRGLTGCSLGGMSIGYAIFCEYLPIRHRARAIICLEMFWGVGSVFEVALGFLVIDTLGWNVFLAFSAVPLALFLLLAPKFMDESARYLLVSGQTEKSRQVLEKIAMENGTGLPQGELVDQLCQNRGRICDLFSSELRKTTPLLLLLWFTNVFIYYGFVLFATGLYASDDPCKGGLDHNSTAEIGATCGLLPSDYWSLIWTSLAELPGAIFCLYFVNIIGRKKTISAEMLLSGLSILSLLACFRSNTTMTVAIFFARGLSFGALCTLNAYTPEVVASTAVEIPIVFYSLLSLVGVILALLLPIETMNIDRG